jgi:CheY-like chemotaxis protein
VAVAPERRERVEALLPPDARVLLKPVVAATLRAALQAPLPAHAQPAAEVRRLQGLRILVVEDNPMNQQVARELLEAEGALIEVAEHGGVAVERLRGADSVCEVVLMDMQMPVMNGLEATRLIRANPQRADLPIVAMTANALDSDRAACLAAGMNDHVGKPFDLEGLVATLLRWAQPRPERSVAEKKAQLAGDPNDPAWAWHGLRASTSPRLWSGWAAMGAFICACCAPWCASCPTRWTACARRPQQAPARTMCASPTPSKAMRRCSARGPCRAAPKLPSKP